MKCPECKGTTRAYFDDPIFDHPTRGFLFIVCPICNGKGSISILRALMPIMFLIIGFALFVFIMWLGGRS